MIAGGGPAGSSAAIVLRNAGHEVVLLERAVFPRPHIGESLPPKVGVLLAILGVHEEVQRAGFVRMTGTTVAQGDDVHTFDFDLVRAPAAPPGPSRAAVPSDLSAGYQVERARFDAILLGRARAAGAEVIEGATVIGLDGAEGGWTGARARLGAGEVRTFEGAFVIDATGARGVVARMLGVRQKELVHTTALAGYFRGASGAGSARGSALPPGISPANTLFEVLPDGWIWSVLLASGRRNVTVGFDTSALRSAARSPSELYFDALARSRLVGPLVAGLELESELSAHDATSFSSDRYAGPGFAIAGDAGSLIDPLTSHGVYKAIHSGISAASVINTILQRPEHTTLALEHYNVEQSRAYARYADLAATFHHASPFVSSPFWAARTRAAPAGPRRFSEEWIAEHAARRDQFRAEVERLGGRGVAVRAHPALSLSRGTVARGGFIVPRAVLTSAEDALFELGGDTHGVDVGSLFPLLDGRTLEAVFEGYAAAIDAPRSSELGRRLTLFLGVLVERGLLVAERPVLG